MRTCNFCLVAFLLISALSITNAQGTNQSRTRPNPDAEDRLRLQKEFFPKISGGTSFALTIIASYAKNMGLQPLTKNHLRSFTQPVGIVSEAVDVNLITGDLILYPGTHDKGEPRKTIINSKDLKELRDVLTSAEFIAIPGSNNKVGMDGTSYVIEVDINDSYTWINHWATDDPNLINTRYKINSIITAAWMSSYAQQIGEGTLKSNHVRLFTDAGTDNTYSIIDIDLVTGKLVRNRRNGTIENKLRTSDISQLKQMLLADDFHKLVTDSRGRLTGGPGANGLAYMIEYDINGVYFRKITSTLNQGNEYFNKVRQQMNNLVYKE